AIGDAFGAGGLGLSGVGEGGGGRGEGIGLGNVGTLGHGANTGPGQGFGNGAERAARPAAKTDELSASKVPAADLSKADAAGAAHKAEGPKADAQIGGTTATVPVADADRVIAGLR